MKALAEWVGRGPSLTRTLLAWLLISQFSLLVVGTYSMHHYAAHLAEAERDLVLEEVADDLAESVYSSLRKGGAVPSGSQMIDLILSDTRDRRYYAVYDAQGRLLAGDTRLPRQHPEFVDGGRDVFSYVTVGGQPMRLVVLRGNDEKFPGLQILVAETLVRRNKLAAHLSNIVLVPQAAILLLTIPLVWFSVHHGLRPLDRLRQDITRRSADELHELPTNDAPRELLPVIVALNGLLARVRASQEEQRRFTSDAAHQIKTPLAALSAEIDLALSDSTCPCAQPTYRRLKASSSRLAHLVRQLLALAHSEAYGGKVHALFDLADLAKDVTSDLVPLASARAIDLGYEGSEQAVVVRGSAILVREAMKNLLENALKFTPHGGSVTVSVQAFPAVFSVADSGPGIPEAEWPLIFSRFHRVPETAHTDGSGLGLAIVQEIARSHGAVVTVGQSALGGALFEFRFPDASVSQT
jgi:two-component system sensor histidine kinase TctE